MNVILSLVGFVLTLSILVVIHEYGHMWVARRFGIKIERFSLGFGKPLLSHRGKDGTLYTLAPIPLGGFVALYGEREDATIPEHARGQTFQGRPAWQRFLIAFAGPAVNLAFAILAFALLFMLGVRSFRPEVSFVVPHSPAAIVGLQAGDLLERINDTETPTALTAYTTLNTRTEGQLSVRYRHQGLEKTATLHHSGHQSWGLFLVNAWQPALIAKVLPQSSAAAMGLQVGDQITAINNQQNLDWSGVSKALAPLGGQTVTLGILRAQKALVLHGTLGRKGPRGFLGVEFQEPDWEKMIVVQRFGPLAALRKGAQLTWFYTRLSFEMFGKMLVHEAPISDNLGGPLTIAEASGKALRSGFEPYLNFLALISLSLAVMNLLPIPALDGGHMALYLLEMVRGKPLSPRVMDWVMRAGVALVLALMVLVLWVDFKRYFF